MTLNKMVCDFLTLVSDLVVDVLSDGTIDFAPFGRFLNHHLIGQNNCNTKSETFVCMILKVAVERNKAKMEV